MTNKERPQTNRGYKKANGKLSLNITPPKHLADPNHQEKGVEKMFKIGMAPKRIKVGKGLAMQVTYYQAVFLRQVRGLNFETDEKTIIKMAKAPLEQVFDNHIYCSDTLCYKHQAMRINNIMYHL